jgi:hypothetical protein
MPRIPKGWLRVPKDERDVTEGWNEDDRYALRRMVIRIAAFIGFLVLGALLRTSGLIR